MDSKRIAWIDIFKGIAIISMVIGHSWSPWTPFIYLFHMPAFLFISGYTTNYDKYTLTKFIYKRVQGLLVPYISINIFFILVRMVLKYFKVDSFFYNDSISFFPAIKQFILHLSTVDFAGATWFLIVLFLSSILSKIIYDFSKLIKYKFTILLFTMLLLYYLAYLLFSNRIILPYMFDLMLVGSFYFTLGSIFKEKEIFEKEINHKIAIPASLLIMYLFGQFIHPQMNWPTRSFSSPVVNFVTSISGIYLLYIISNAIKKFEFLGNIFVYIGRRTLAILILHFMVFRITFVIFFLLGLLDLGYLKELTPRANNHFWHFITISSIAFILLLERILARSNIISFLFLGKNANYKKRIIE
ncbi:acyltransferase family protein [Paenibacillus sp. 5J-6]|uniref:Acyltransferase family protein n=1 Tax=Paenibacillus silvestris TaxID=2606219 RepID=A0A6L8V391_9BACL|nr:acyltransferase family protein [Paenibacillus silvestris]MZQ83730.1 acyltransferase family protein [Paenibacillus silvestris]